MLKNAFVEKDETSETSQNEPKEGECALANLLYQVCDRQIYDIYTTMPIDLL